MQNTITKYLAQVQHLLPEAKAPGMAAEIVTFFEAGDSAEVCVSALRDYYAAKAGHARQIIVPRQTTGRPQSASLAAARLVRDYGKNRALHMAVRESDNNPMGSKDSVFWTDVGMSLLEDI